jgi:hypothetical protein
LSFHEEGVIDPIDKTDLPTTLSHSSDQTLRMCEAKYYFYKVAKVPHDPDSKPDWHPFKFGSALHHIAEHTHHTRKEFKRRILIEAMEAEDLSDEMDFYHLYACIMAYYEVSDRSGLTIVLCEMEIRSNHSYGKIDAIGIDKRGRFWIVDLKSTGWWKDLLPNRLTHDPQLNLYTEHLPQVVEALRDLGYDVDLADFAGVIYRAVCKTKLVPGYQESLESFRERANIRCYFMHVLKEDMDVERVVAEHKAMWLRAMDLGADGATQFQAEEMGHEILPPRRNYAACLEFNHTCEYWSQCYGCTATESKKKVHISRTAVRNNKTGKVIEPENIIDVGDLVWTPPNINKEELDMLNVVVKETNWFPSEKSCRVIVSCSLGGQEYSRPFYFETAKTVDAAWMNECIERAMNDIKVQFWIHLSNLRQDQIFHAWCEMLGVKGLPPPKGGFPTTVQSTKEEAKPAAKAAPVTKEEPEDEEEEKPVAKPAKAAKPAPKEEPEEDEEEEEKPVAKGKAKVKAADEVVWVAGNKETSPLLMTELDGHWGKKWREKAAKKARAVEISTALAKKKVVVLRDGEVTDEFQKMVEKLADE